MAVLIDTDLLVDLELGVGAPEVELLLGEEERAISVITMSELLVGVEPGRGVGVTADPFPRPARRTGHAHS